MRRLSGRGRERVRKVGRGLVALIVLVAVFALGWIAGGSARPGPADGHADHAGEDGIWTCSMHPQIRREEPGSCPICGMQLVPVETDGDGARQDPRRIRLTETARALARVQVVGVQRLDVKNDLRLHGKVQYDETAVEHVTAWFPGRIDRLWIDFTGEKIERGQSLAKLYSPQLLLAQDELIQAVRMVENMSMFTTPDGSGASQLEETLEASRERLRLWGMTARQIEAVETSGKPRKHVTLTSRISGVVIEKNAFEGMYVEEGTRLFTVANLESLWVMLDAYESDLAHIEEQQEVTFEVEAYPGKTFQGTVAFIDPVIDPSTRTARVRVEVDNADGMLKPEMFVTAEVEATIDGGSDIDGPPLVIPASAPLITGKRAIVYVRDPHDEGLFEVRRIELGPRAGDHYVVLSGLDEGELVVVKGNFKIDSALQIQAGRSMMQPSAGQGAHEHHDGGASPILSDPPSRTFDAPAGFLEQLDAVVDRYLAMQAALAGDDIDGALAAAGDLDGALDATDMKLLEGEAHVAWMEMLGAASDALARVSAASGIGEVRDAFSPLSEAVILMVRSFGSPGKRVLYLKHCPMAMGGEGADWLQAVPETLNPYYGSEMLTCAEDVQRFGTTGEEPADE